MRAHAQKECGNSVVYGVQFDCRINGRRAAAAEHSEVSDHLFRQYACKKSHKADRY